MIKKFQNFTVKTLNCENEPLTICRILHILYKSNVELSQINLIFD